MRCKVWVALCSTIFSGATAACGAAVPPVPGRGGPAWTELSSEHFTVWSDGDPTEVRELAQQMEHLRQVIVGVAFPSVPARGRTLVFALRNDDELSAFSATDQPRAYATAPHLPLWQPTIVLSASSVVQGRDRTVAHELTHVISKAIVHSQPRWLAEGMATYFETMQLDVDRGTVDVGVAPNMRGKPRRMPHLIPVEQLFAWRNVSADEDHEYTTAWALFSYLLNTHRDELGRYLLLLRDRDDQPPNTTMDDAAQQWRDAFPALSLGDIDSKLRQWLLSGKHDVTHFTVQLRTWPITERRLSDSDVYAARATLYLLINRPAEARSNATAALSLDPGNVPARLLASALDHGDITPDQAHTMTAAHRDDWRAWWFTAIELSKAGADAREITNARRAACTLFAQNPALFAPSDLCASVPSGEHGAPR